MTDRYDIVIVGAGHNGLTAAFYLARAGLRTLVLERRELVGGACVTEEIAPGVRASTTSYIASMLRPEIVADLGLAERGLRMVPCEPGLQVVFEDRPVLPWWSTHERTAEEIRRISAHDADAFGRVTERLHELARSLQPFFLEEAPNLYATGWSKLREGRRLFRRFRHLSGDQLSDLVRFATGSLGEFVERHFESDEVRRLYLANNVYGMHAPPYRPGTAIGLLFHMLSGGEHHIQGFNGHVIGGMGSITQAMASAVRDAGAEIRTNAEVARIDVREGRATGVTLEDGTEISARTVVSNADPKRTFLGLVEKSQLDEGFRADVEAIAMAGPCAKVNFALDAGAPLARHARGRGPEPAVARDARADARGRAADVRPAPMGRDPGRAVGRLRHLVERGRHARAPGHARDDGVRAVRAVRAAVGHLGRAARRARAQGGRDDLAVHPTTSPRRSGRCRSSRRWTWNAPTG